MARTRSPNRDKAFELWKQSSGKMLLKEIATELGVSDTQIRKWKNQDNWDDKSKVTLPKTKGNVTNGKSNVTKKQGRNQCKATALSGERCKVKAIPGSDFCRRHANKIENQCTAKSKQTGEQCKNKALPGKTKCKFHGGKSIGSPGHQNHLTHGLFSTFIPDDKKEEAEAFMKEIEGMSTLDITWQKIKFLCYKIAMSEKIAWVEGKNDQTKVLKRKKRTSLTDEVEYEIQHAWDKNNSNLKALALIEKELDNKIKLYEELLEKYELKGLVVEEHRLRVEKLKADIAKAQDEEDKPIEVIIKRKSKGVEDK